MSEGGYAFPPDFTDDFDDEQWEAHNEAMENDPQYRDAVYMERH